MLHSRRLGQHGVLPRLASAIEARLELPFTRGYHLEKGFISFEIFNFFFYKTIKFTTPGKGIQQFLYVIALKTSLRSPGEVWADLAWDNFFVPHFYTAISV